MSGLDFDPLTDQYGITGTSYSLQMGLINSKWAVSLLKGKETKATFLFNDRDLVEDFPTSESIVSWTLRAIVIPNINSHQVRKTVHILRKQAKFNKDKKKFVTPIKEANEVKLKSVPKSVLRIPKPSGWVVDNVPTSTNNIKETEMQCLEKVTCISCGCQVKYCPNCGTELNENNYY